MKKLILAGLLTVSALAGTASAQTKIYIAGAPAFRQIGTQAVLDTLASTTTGGSGSLVVASTNSSISSANSLIITGGTLTKGGTPVTVKITYSGSTAAVQSLAAGTGGTAGVNSFKVLYLNDGATGTSNSDPTASGAVAANFDAEYPNFGLIDTFQNTTPFHGASKLTGSTINYSTLNEYGSPNAIIPYKFVANAGAPTNLNLTPGLAQYLWLTGTLPLAFLTGNESDETTNVYAVGRDPASGSRYIHLAETGIGPVNDAAITQNIATLTTTSGVTKITGYTPPPATTINAVPIAQGNGGYSSFTPVLAALKTPSANGVGFFITYVGAPDAKTALTSSPPAVEVSWNGNVLGDGFGTNDTASFEGTAPANLAEGKYTFWSYIHVFFPTGLSTTNAAANTFAQNVYNDLGTDTTTTAVLVSDVGVTRTADGGRVTATYQ